MLARAGLTDRDRAGTVPVSITTPDGTSTLNDAYAFAGASALDSRAADHAAVAPPPNGGTVTFSIDGVPVGTANVAGSMATLTTIAPSALAPHTIGAQFNGVPVYASSNAPVIINVMQDIPMFSPHELALLVLALGVRSARASLGGQLMKTPAVLAVRVATVYAMHRH